ncbi:GntR family transcriptional regulator [Jannaschia sp. Os4]|uniref:GntR family transcriptional regulator n=1 Tax=Jannaschia sp. Os4 TaxID=2807617 RepID=UPI0019397279|nr:GntR family transcriptional regulator [Jannaschia sp. Os4]MBM2578032.1 GntR family transcriptional regulator [Jannaschia sp. Os4]
MEQRRAETIADEIEELILSDAFADGDRLDEATLAERFGVSRTPVREAIQRLSLTGLVDLRPRRGAFVRQPGPVELLEMFEVMAEIEAVCARLAAARIEDDALAGLAAANAACAAAVEAGDADGYYRANEGFHLRLYAESGNRFLEGEAQRLHRRLKPYRRLQLRLRGRMAQSLAEHREIIAALEAGDAACAATATRDHVAVQGEKFRRLMSTRATAAE